MAENLSSSTKFNWEIKNFSKLKPHRRTYSDIISVGSFKWRAGIYPKGHSSVYNQYLSLFLYPVDLKLLVDTKFTFAVTSQSDPYTRTVWDLTKEFPIGSFNGWGWPEFMRLRELHDPKKGYIVNDTCVITVEVTCTTKDVSQGCPNKDKVAKTGSEKQIAKTGSEKQTKEKDDKSSLESGGYPGAGQPFGEGRDNNNVGFGSEGEFEDVGGFSIMKAQAPLYRQIWLKYGHIPSTKVMPISFYPILVMVVKNLMNCISDMHQCHYVELSSKMIEQWEEMIIMAETNKFNVGWLREILETAKKGMGGMQNVKTELLEHGQPIRAAKEKMKVLKDVIKKVEVQMKKVEVELVAAKANARENTCGLLSESDMEMYLEIGENLMLDGLF
ncbi:hypothetical protein MKX03_014617 [Papaver bracteatum]|nr:hypothetical protein MKX03_014617 [Papaver bracteatum]